MAHLFSKLPCSAASDAVLGALLSVFSRYVQRMRKSKEGEEVYSWVRRWTAGRGGGQLGEGVDSWARRVRERTAG
jgi:hypothetical protein